MASHRHVFDFVLLFHLLGLVPIQLLRINHQCHLDAPS